ncbi:MAG: WYL domain-containing protein [Gammaproteobacteria bacterium]|nr:MAG: WYL domain-containing protein [Gammaproteobacteria bacterium]
MVLGKKSQQKQPADIKWNSRQRLQYIELMAWYTGVVSRSDVASTFGLSDPAATKDLKLYGELAPDNLIYKHSVFGFVPGPSFKEVFADLTPSVALPMIAGNLTTVGGPTDDKLIYGIHVDTLPLPSRLPDKAILAQITRAAKHHKKCQVSYHSMSPRDNNDSRIIEPHSFINNGLRWHVRAYNEDSFDFRDFVLSRMVDARMLEQDAESSAHYDDDWVETFTLQLAPHPDLTPQQQQSLLVDYAATDNIIEISVRRALLGYVLQRMSVDTTREHSLNPNAYQLVVVNREEIEPFAGWAFL